MKLIAKQAFHYADRALKAGDEFTAASSEDARILKGVGKAEDAQASDDSSAAQADEEPARVKGRRGRYQRSNMRAED
jgi:hypothetical protein